MVLKAQLAAAALSVMALSACTTEQVVQNSGDAVVFVGSTAVRAAVGAGRLAARGAAAGVRQIREATADYPAGTLVCVDDAGVVYAEAVIRDNMATCPPQAGA